jgi:hypothetical protein
MARAKKRSKDEGQESGEVMAGSPVRRMEALGIVLLVLALALSFALVSFDPSDRGGRNLIGPVGRGVAAGILGGVGVIGYVIATLGVIGAGAVLVGRARWPRALAVFSALGLTLSSTVFAHLVSGGGSAFGHPAGGLIGAMLGEAMRGFIGSAGAGLAAMGLFCVSILGVADLSFGAAARDGFSILKGAFLRLTHGFQTWREARATEAEHEQKLIEEESEKRRTQEQARAEKEQKLKDQLEEKKRLAILKAQAKAEEKVLARRAAEEARARLEEEERLEAERQAEDERLAQEAAAAALGASAAAEEDAEAGAAEAGEEDASEGEGEDDQAPAVGDEDSLDGEVHGAAILAGRRSSPPRADTYVPDAREVDPEAARSGHPCQAHGQRGDVEDVIADAMRKMPRAPRRRPQARLRAPAACCSLQGAPLGERRICAAGHASRSCAPTASTAVPRPPRPVVTTTNTCPRPGLKIAGSPRIYAMARDPRAACGSSRRSPARAWSV